MLYRAKITMLLRPYSAKIVIYNIARNLLQIFVAAPKPSMNEYRKEIYPQYGKDWLASKEIEEKSFPSLTDGG